MYCFIKKRECRYAGQMIYNGCTLFEESEGIHTCTICYKKGGEQSCNY